MPSIWRVVKGVGVEGSFVHFGKSQLISQSKFKCSTLQTLILRFNQPLPPPPIDHTFAQSPVFSRFAPFTTYQTGVAIAFGEGKYPPNVLHNDIVKERSMGYPFQWVRMSDTKALYILWWTEGIFGLVDTLLPSIHLKPPQAASASSSTSCISSSRLRPGWNHLLPSSGLPLSSCGNWGTFLSHCPML